MGVVSWLRAALLGEPATLDQCERCSNREPAMAVVSVDGMWLRLCAECRERVSRET